MINYLIRLDDACPTMDSAKWESVERILDAYGVRPMVGVIPHNEDPDQLIDAPDASFWDKVKVWDQKGWAIALHGYNHCYTTESAGINPLWNRSEFAGMPLDVQRDKIRFGIDIMRAHGIRPSYFFAPSHTFDENTLTALYEESDIRIISDTLAFRPYRYGAFVFVPQVGGSCRRMIFPGIWTFCLHPNTMSEDGMAELKRFLQRYSAKFIRFQDLDYEAAAEKTIADCAFSSVYFLRRSLKRKN